MPKQTLNKNNPKGRNPKLTASKNDPKGHISKATASRNNPRSTFKGSRIRLESDSKPLVYMTVVELEEAFDALQKSMEEFLKVRLFDKT